MRQPRSVDTSSIADLGVAEHLHRSHLFWAMFPDIMETKGGRLALYRAWLKERWAEWRRINGVAPDAVVSYAQHQAFDSWLRFRSERDQGVAEQAL